MVYYKSVSAIAGGGKTAVLLNTFSKGLARCSGSNWVFFPDPNWLCAPGANSIGDWHLAEDLVQETFLTACWKANQICSHSNPTAWLYKTLNNLIMRELHRSYHKDVALDEWNEARESMNLPMHLYLPTGLSEQDKELILLRIDKKLSFDEIAEYYGITNDACRQRLSRAIRKCRSLLDCEK